MSDKITISFINEHGREFAIGRAVDPREVAMARAPKVRIQIGFSSITMSRPMLGEMLRQLDMAEATGAEYPDDLEGLTKAGYGVARNTPGASSATGDDNDNR